MSAGTKIEWTEATWNPVTGCDRVSPGCDNCYAERIATRFGRPFIGEVQLHPARLDIPLRWRKPRRVFVNSVSDLFHPDVPDEFIERVFFTMGAAPRHTFQVLTKRPQRMAKLLDEAFRHRLVQEHGLSSAYRTWPLPNVWLGVSVENQRYADLRIPHLLATPAAVRFLSVEPMLGPVRLDERDIIDDVALDEFVGVDWVIVGGESGPGARPMDPQWGRDVRDQCTAAGVPYFFKQWGEWIPYEPDPQPPFWVSQHGDIIDGHHLPADLNEHNQTRGWWAPPDLDDDAIYRRVGKKAAGRLLDGREWNEYPT